MTVRYEAVNAMLLNEFLKEHQKVEKLECTVAMQEKDFKATIAQQQKQIEALTATVQKVSDQMALSKPAPQLVANPEKPLASRKPHGIAEINKLGSK
jgi:uncharacterized coiled-coil protein SlyX